MFKRKKRTGPPNPRPKPISLKEAHERWKGQNPSAVDCYTFARKAWIKCWRMCTEKYYKGEPMHGIYVDTDTLEDDEIFKIVEKDFEAWWQSV